MIRGTGCKAARQGAPYSLASRSPNRYLCGRVERARRTAETFRSVVFLLPLELGPLRLL